LPSARLAIGLRHPARHGVPHEENRDRRPESIIRKMATLVNSRSTRITL
jgi:hypothetical protein